MENKALIDKFSKYQKACSVSPKRILKYSYTLNKMSKILKKPFAKAKKDDIVKVIGWVEEQPYTAWTKHDYKVCLKRFYKWLNGDVDFPDTVRWIKATVKMNNAKLPEQLLTEEDIDTLVNTATNIRDKAFVRCLYESGCRINELLQLQIKNIDYDEYSPIIVVTGKTGVRRIRLIDKDGLLKTWLKAHPLKDDPNAYVWISLSNSRKNEPLAYKTISDVLKELQHKSGIKKPINPHNFRHSRATHLAVKLTEAQMKQMFGWTQSSEMASIYVHLSGRDLDEPLLRMSGLLDQQEAKKQKMTELLSEEISSDPKSYELFKSIIERLKDKGKLQGLDL
jgi:site-specific recombinase XerD